MTETLLVLALIARITGILRLRLSIRVPRAYWYWLVWVVLELLSWLRSPDIAAGAGEMRHAALLGAMFLMVPAITSARHAVLIWRSLFFTSTAGSAALIIIFVSRSLADRPEDTNPTVFLRNGGLLHHWMVYGIVEIVIIGGLLEFWRHYPGERLRLSPLMAVHGAAIALSLTRTLWVCCILLLLCHLLWRRSRWIWAVPALPALLLAISPAVVRARITESIEPAYYSNAERIQMLRVGWAMIRDRPLTGVGPGRVEQLYSHYLSPGEPLPAFHGHLHNNAVQLAAEFGFPVAAAAALFVVVLLRDLLHRCRTATTRHTRFLCRAALLGTAGFIAAGLFDYTYGHSLGLILIGFVALTPLCITTADPGAFPGERDSLG